MSKIKTFADYKNEGHNWITLATGEYYPDILPDACQLYAPVLITFSQILKTSESSERLFMNISEIKEQWMRVQLARVFRKYVSPSTPVEMLKKKTKASDICDQFGQEFRPIQEVQKAFNSRPIPDEALCAILWEYRSRGQKGYDLTEKFFSIFRMKFPGLIIEGPERAGKDIRLGDVLDDYPNPQRPVDFIIFNETKKKLLCVGLARYDSDRGGAQEDDRTGGYKNCADEILNYSKLKKLDIKVVFINDGPGLLLGSMWNDYSTIEKSWPNKIIVATLRMVPERITKKWLLNNK